MAPELTRSANPYAAARACPLPARRTERSVSLPRPAMKEGFLSASAALAAFSESFVESRRVLVFGSSLSAAPRLLIERGARMVQVCDPNPARVEEAAERLAAPGLAFTTFSDELLQAREGSFDFVLVE